MHSFLRKLISHNCSLMSLISGNYSETVYHFRSLLPSRYECISIGVPLITLNATYTSHLNILAFKLWIWVLWSFVKAFKKQQQYCSHAISKLFATFTIFK